MKFLLGLILFVLLYLAMLVFFPYKSESVKVTQYQPKTHEEKSCSMPMCESLGGHDAIALQVMFGD